MTVKIVAFLEVFDAMHTYHQRYIYRNLKLKWSSLLLLCTLFFVAIPFINGQEKQDFLFTKGDNNVSVITMGSASSAHCTVIEYPNFLVLHEIPNIPFKKPEQDSTINIADAKANLLLTFLDSIYSNKPVQYILNSHYHTHSLSIVTPFLDKGAKLITAKENIKVYDKKGLFGDKTSAGYLASIIQITADTTLLTETKNPIDILYLKKADYQSIPTTSYLFFNFPAQKLLATSCMVYLKDIDTQYGYKAIMYNNRLLNVNKIIADKNLDIDNTLQLYRFSTKNGLRKPPIFPISHFQNVLEHSWHRRALSEHFQNMSYETLTTKRDSILNYLIESDIYHIVLNHAVYELIEKKEYLKAVAIAQILVNYEPNRLNEIDTLGEAYFNNGQIDIAKHYNTILKKAAPKTEDLGLAMWEKNQADRLKKGS